MHSLKENIFWLLLLVVVFSFGVFYQYQEKGEFEQYNVIKSDGTCYYSYLPSTFLSKENQTKEGIDYYMLLDRNDKTKHNKFFIGTSFFMTPFFVLAHSYVLFRNALNPNYAYPPDGYSLPYQIAIGISGAFYLVLGLYFLAVLLSYLGVDKRVVYGVSFFFAMGTQLLTLSSYEASFSHIYSFFVIATILLLTYKIALKPNLRLFLLLSALFAVLALIRPTNVLVVLALPIIFELTTYKRFFRWLSQQRLAFVYALGIMAGIIFIQLLYWKLETNHFIIWSYSEEGFNFLHPEFFKVLFSFKKGLFVYTPLLLVAFAIIFFSALSLRIKGLFLLFFVINNYVISSWWCWWYGGSYGMRPWMEFMPVVILLVALSLNKMDVSKVKVITVFSFLALWINLVQTYQYATGIIHWSEMNWDKFQQVFLRTHSDFRFVTYDLDTSYKHYIVVDSLTYSARQNPEPKALVLNNERPFDAVFEVSKDSMYQANFKWNAQQLFNDTLGTYVKVKFDGRLENMTGGAVVVSTANCKNKDCLVWNSVRLIKLIRRAEEWNTVEAIFDLKKPNPKWEDYQIYFFNDRGNKVWVKNIEVTFYYYLYRD